MGSYAPCMRRIVVLLTVLVVLVALSGPASAHAAYKSSDPADRSTVSSPPSRVSAEFTEPLAQGSYLQITDPCGSRVDGGDVSIVGYEMAVSMSGSRSGTYTAFYKALSQLDPHVVEGTFTFGVTSGPGCEPTTQEPPLDSTDPDPSEDTDENSTQADDPLLAQSDSSGSGPGSTTGGGGNFETGRSTGRSSRPPGREPIAAKVPNIAARERPAEERDASVYDGIPMGSFAISLVLAALIGAAGGKIYAGIMGPRA